MGTPMNEPSDFGPFSIMSCALSEADETVAPVAVRPVYRLVPVGTSDRGMELPNSAWTCSGCSTATHGSGGFSGLVRSLPMLSRPTAARK